MNFNWYLLSSLAFRLANWPRRRREARELEAMTMAARRSLWQMQGRGQIGTDVNLLARDIPFLDARTENGRPVVTIRGTAAVVPELANQRRGQESLN